MREESSGKHDKTSSFLRPDLMTRVLATVFHKNFNTGSRAWELAQEESAVFKTQGLVLSTKNR